MTHNIEQARTRRVGNPVQFNVLGPVTVVDGREPLNTGGPKQRTVLAMLIADVGRPVSNDVIAEAVYGENSPKRARRRVQVYVSTLRSIVGDVIVKEGGGWALRVDRSQVDALRFEDLYESVRGSDEIPPESVAQVLREALALWRGHPYSDVESHGYLEAEVFRLAELRVAVQAARIDADLESGRHADLIGEIEGLISEHPYLEQFRAQHMLALYRAGRQREALRSFEEMRTLLVEELGVDPTPELQELEQRILEQNDSLDLIPRKQIQKKAVLVADPGDPIELARLPSAERGELLSIAGSELRRALGESALLPAGTASYAIFDTVGEAAAAAEAMTLRTDGAVMRMAIDFGDVEVSDGAVSGVPVARASVLVSVAHRGQVLLSSDAQQAVVSGDDGAGLRFEALGRFDLAGIQDTTAVHQLLVGDPPPTFPPLDTDRTPVPLPDGGDRAVPGYELREPMGPGSVGTAYRAYQPSVGREVMVEVIGRTEASDPAFIRSFEADAQRLALLDHPNINPLLDYWRDPDGAFLVYRYHRGGLLNDGSVEKPDRLIEQIGRALGHAHSYGVVHGSVRPDRVVLDESGNGYLMGFPLAGVAPKSSPDHAAYIAPETLAGEAATEATDVFGLGVLALELLEGPVAGDSPLRPESAVIARAVDEDPSDRHESVATFLSELYPGGSEPGERFTKSRNPYKGLAAFHESDAGDFFGRGAVVEELVSALAEDRFLAVVGPSGIGKSSVVRAGLISALRHGAIDGSDEWVITDMLPGPRPFLELERALERVAVDLPADVRERFAERDANALAGLGRVLPDRSELLLVIDQFEELFTMTDEVVASAFLVLLVNAVAFNQARIVVTLRADFLDRPLLFSEFGELLRESMVGLRSPNPTELGEAIIGPARGVGVDVDAGLVERLVSDVHDRPGGLPLLQFALVELFDSRESDLLTLEVHEEIGGVTGSLARRAEGVYEGLETDQQSSIKQVFLRLVTVIDDSPPTRRRVRVTELDDLDAEQAIDAFARSRMLVFDNHPDTRTPTVEVAHEALLTEWPRLAGWIEATREDLTLSRRLDDAIRDWNQSGRDEAYLLSGGRLAQHEGWVESTTLSLGKHAESFLAASRDYDAAMQAKRRRRRNLITAGFAMSAVIAGLLAFFAVQNAATARSEALAASAVAALESDPELAVLLGIQAIELNSDNGPSLTAINKALQAHRAVFRVADSTAGSISPDGKLVASSTSEFVEVRELDRPGAEPLWQRPLWDDHVIGDVYFTDDSSRVIVVSFLSPRAGGECSWDRFTVLEARTGEIYEDTDFEDRNTYFGGPSQTGPYVDLTRPVVLGPGGAVDCQANPIEGDLVAADLLTGDLMPLVVGASPSGRSWIGLPTLNKEGSVFAWTGNRGGAVIDLRTGDEIMSLPPGQSTLNADGTRILTGNDPLELWTLDPAQKRREFKASFRTAWFSASGSMVYGNTHDGRILVYDADLGDLLFEFKGQGTDAGKVQMTDDETRIASSATEGMTVWEIGRPVMPTAGPTQFLPGPDGELSFFGIGANLLADDYLVSTRFTVLEERGLYEDLPSVPGYDETIVYDAETAEEVNTYAGRVLAVSPDGGSIALQASGGLKEANQIDGPAPDGTYVQIGGVIIADVETGEPIVELEGLCTWYDGPQLSVRYVPDRCPGFPDEWADWINHASFSPDGERLAVLGQTGRFVVWDLDTGVMEWRLDSPEGLERALLFNDGSVAFTPDGKYLLTAIFTGERSGDQSSTVTVRRVDSPDVIEGEFETRIGGPSRMEFTPGGDRLVLNDQGQNLLVVDTSSWEILRTFKGGQQTELITDIAVDPLGRWVATAGRDGISVLWDIESGEEVQRFDFSATPLGLRNVEWVDPQTLLVGSRFWAVQMTVEPDVLVDHALGRLTRSFTQSECATYDIDPCPTTLEEMRSD